MAENVGPVAEATQNSNTTTATSQSNDFWGSIGGLISSTANAYANAFTQKELARINGQVKVTVAQANAQAATAQAQAQQASTAAQQAAQNASVSGSPGSSSSMFGNNWQTYAIAGGVMIVALIVAKKVL